MVLSQVPHHYSRETHQHAVESAHMQDRALAAMSGLLYQMPQPETLPLTPPAQAPLTNTSEDVSSISYVPNSETLPSPHSLADIPMLETPISPAEHSAPWIEDLNIQAGVHQPTYGEANIAQAMRRLQQGRGVQALDFTVDNSDKEDLGVEVDEAELKELRETMQRLMQDSDQSYAPWPSKNVCQLE
jgi:hypothetical protein